jgi:hypothetical protein
MSITRWLWKGVACSLDSQQPAAAPNWHRLLFALPTGAASNFLPFTSFTMDRSPNSELLRESLAKNTRRRSLKTLFQLPLSTRTSTYGSLTTTTAVGSIPADIVRDIVDLLPPSDILSLSLAVRISFILDALCSGCVV